MKAIRVEKHRGPEVLKLVEVAPIEAPGPGLPGAYSEAILADAERLIPLPEEFTFEEGAAFPLQGMTAHYLIHEFRQLVPGSFVLIHAAAGGMGGLLVQWAKHLGANVIGTVSTDAKARTARISGADHVILYAEQDFVAETKRITNGLGADLIIDGVGSTTFKGDLEAAAVRGQEHSLVFGKIFGRTIVHHGTTSVVARAFDEIMASRLDWNIRIRN